MIDDIVFDDNTTIFELEVGTFSAPIDIVYDGTFREDIPADIIEVVTIFV